MLPCSIGPCLVLATLATLSQEMLGKGKARGLNTFFASVCLFKTPARARWWHIITNSMCMRLPVPLYLQKAISAPIFFQLLFYDVQRRWKILCEAKRKCGERNCASKVYKAINYQPAPFPRDENSVDTAIRYNQAPGALFFQTSWWKTTPASWRGVKRAFFASSPPSSRSRSCIIDLRAATQISERKVLSKRIQDTSLHLVELFQSKILLLDQKVPFSLHLKTDS